LMRPKDLFKESILIIILSEFKSTSPSWDFKKITPLYILDSIFFIYLTKDHTMTYLGEPFNGTI
jgi:hypothetical protein